jgi:hypothetical protein
MMTEINNKPIFKLGRVSFCVDGASEQFKADMLSLLPTSTGSDSADIHHLEVVDDLRLLLNEVLRHHDGCTWIDAACLISPDDQRVIIAGKSGVGKSTTAIALVHEYGWTALAEDLVLIDTEKDELIGLTSPFSLKAGTLDLLRATIANVPDTIIRREWVANKATLPLPGLSASFDLALYFDFAGSTEQPEITRLSAAEYLRLILPCSNLLHQEGAPDRMVEYLKNASCFRISGGTLLQRLHFILSFCDGCENELQELGAR